MIVEAAKQESLTITPPDLVTVPEVFRRADGTSRFRPRHASRLHLRDRCSPPRTASWPGPKT